MMNSAILNSRGMFGGIDQGYVQEYNKLMDPRSLEEIEEAEES